MKTIETIIAEHNIDNPTDASLVRLVGAVSSLPDTEVSEILRRTSFPNPSDTSLASALASAIRLGAQTPNPRRKSLAPWLLTVALAAATLTLGVKSVGDAKTIASLNTQVDAQAAQLASQVEKLSAIAATNEKFVTSVSAGQSQAAKIYTEAQMQLTQSNEKIIAENAQLKVTNAALMEKIDGLLREQKKAEPASQAK
jgi:hypothetical protein